MTSDSASAPGLISGHAKLAQGIISSSIGNLTGSTGMQTSGEETKQAGISELKEYQAQNPPPADGTGSGIEAKIGSAVGCEGLVNSATGDTSQPTSTSSSGIIASDADAKGSLGNLGGTDQPGKPTGGASGGVSGESKMPDKLV